MFYATKDILQPVIVTPVYNITTGILPIYAVSDMWSDVTGEASFEWITYEGTSINSTTAQLSTTVTFVVAAVNYTVVDTMNITEMTSQGLIPADNAVLITSLTATGTNPNADSMTKTFTHSNYFTATPLSKAKLADLGLKISHSGKLFTVMVENAVSVFTWMFLDHSDAAVIVVFDDNGLFLRKGESRTFGYHVVSGTSSGWEDRVMVRSIWDNTLM